MAKKTITKRKSYNKPPKAGTSLTPVQLRIMLRCAKGKTYKEIGDAVGMSKDGVDWHMRQILVKLRATTGTHAVYKAFKLGLVK
jgi:DNA-binding NarL/FixJ family response regulator